MSAVSKFSEEMGNMVETAGASLVRVEARNRFPASGIVLSNDGYVVTANHVVRRDSKIGIGFADGSFGAAQLIGRDPSTDIALLKADGADFSSLTLTDTVDLRVGNLVLALGRPGNSIQATMGIISALGPAWRTRRGGQADSYIQTDVLMYPGFSGGPLVSSDGKLVGLNSSALVPGISVAMPSETLSRVVNALQEHGRVRRGYLGVSTQVVRLQQPIRETLGQKTGLLVVAVEAGSPADDAGLTIGDTIVNLSSSTIRHHDDLLAALAQANLEEKAPLTMVRGGELKTINVHIDEQA